MPTCRHCYCVYPREQFIHGNGPKAQVCVRCGVEKGLVSEEEVASLYNNSTANARFSALARRWSPLMWLSVLWIAWIVFLNDVEPWGALHPDSSSIVLSTCSPVHVLLLL